MKDRSKQRQTTVTVVHKFKVLVYTVIITVLSIGVRSSSNHNGTNSRVPTQVTTAFLCTAWPLVMSLVMLRDVSPPEASRRLI